MSDDYMVTKHSVQNTKGRILIHASGSHIVSDACKLGNFRRQLAFITNKRAKLTGDLPVHAADGCHFNDTVLLRIKSACFKVNDGIGMIIHCYFTTVFKKS
ncbi:hypothetical protein D3C71_1985760 [compost metagenome]